MENFMELPGKDGMNSKHESKYHNVMELESNKIIFLNTGTAYSKVSSRTLSFSFSVLKTRSP
jgi:hypothetical protein